MKLYQYDEKLVRVTDPDGRVFSGAALFYPAEYCLHEYGREEECLEIGGYVFYPADIARIEFLPTFEETLAAVPPGSRRFLDDDRYYTAVFVARHGLTQEPMVVCRPDLDDGSLWVFPADAWREGAP